MATRNAIKEDLKSASRFRFKKLLKESVISKYWLAYFIIGKLCAEPLFYFASLFICLCICLSITAYIFLLCVHLFIYNNFDI